MGFKCWTTLFEQGVLLILQKCFKVWRIWGTQTACNCAVQNKTILVHSHCKHAVQTCNKTIYCINCKEIADPGRNGHQSSKWKPQTTTKLRPGPTLRLTSHACMICMICMMFGRYVFHDVMCSKTCKILMDVCTRLKNLPS